MPEAASTPTAEPKRGFFDLKKNLKQLVAIAVVLTAAYMLFPGVRQAVNRTTAKTGLTVTPWIERADTVLNDMMARPDQQKVIGQIVVAITHPTGNFDKVASCKVSREGETLKLRLQVDWKGGIIGTAYATKVEWRCNKMGHISAEVVEDNGPAGVAAENRKQLDEYFRTKVWPPLFSNTGG